MGVPWRAFEVLVGLQGDDRRHVESLLDRVHLFTLVIADGERDQALLGRLVELWGRLDADTGRHMIFVAPVEPPLAWVERPDVRGRPYLQPGRRSQEHLLDAPVADDPTRAMRTLATALGVPPLDRPVLVVLPRLGGREGWWMEATPERLREDLRELGALATDLAEGDDPGVLGPGIARIAGARLVEAFTTLAPSAGDALAGVTAEAVMTSDGASGYERDKALRFLTRRARPPAPDRDEEAVGGETRNDDELGDVAAPRWRPAPGPLKRAEGAGPDDAGEGREGGLLATALATEQLVRATRGRPGAASAGRLRAEAPAPAGLGPVAELWEPAARDFIERGDLLLRDAGLEPRFAMLLWGLGVEHELATTLGHAVRAQLGVRLPGFWWLHQPRLADVVVQAEGQRIDFNRRPGGALGQDRARWEAPSLGLLRLGVAAAFQACPPPWTDLAARPEWAPFLAAWTELGQLRNLVAHPHPVSVDHALRMRALVETLAESPVMRAAQALKPGLRGH